MHISKELTPGAAAGLLLFSAVLCDPAMAQSRTEAGAPDVGVRDRVHPEFAARGLRLRGFVVYPELATEFQYDDNVLRAETDAQDDFVSAFKPAVVARTDWSRHQLELRAGGVIRRYADLSSENAEEWRLSGDGRLDFRGGAAVSGGGSFESLVEPRSASGAPADAVSPVEYDLTSVNVGATRRFARWEVAGRLDHRSYDFHDARAEDGAVIEQDGRDRDVASLLVRADYVASPDTTAFLAATANDRSYDAPGGGGPDRSSTGYEVLAGVRLDLARLVRGEVAVGYLEQSYDSPVLEDVSGASYRVQLEWFATGLTTVTLGGGRSVEEATLASASSYLSSTGQVQVDHELRRNVILTGQANFARDEYQGISRQDDTSGAGVGLTYILNRNLGLSLTYDHLKRSSSGDLPGRSFEDDRAAISLMFKL